MKRARAIALLDAAVRVEAFLSGFEDDASQQGMPMMLADLRRAIARARPAATTATSEVSLLALSRARGTPVSFECHPLGVAPHGQIVRVRVTPRDPSVFDFHAFAAGMNEPKPLIVGPLEFVTIFASAEEVTTGGRQGGAQ